MTSRRDFFKLIGKGAAAAVASAVLLKLPKESFAIPESEEKEALDFLDRVHYVAPRDRFESTPAHDNEYAQQVQKAAKEISKNIEQRLYGYWDGNMWYPDSQSLISGQNGTPARSWREAFGDESWTPPTASKPWLPGEKVNVKAWLPGEKWPGKGV